MSNEFKLSVDKRNLLNKGGRKRARKDGIIPGVYYSHDSKKSIPFSISKKEIFNAQKADTQIFGTLSAHFRIGNIHISSHFFTS